MSPPNQPPRPTVPHHLQRPPSAPQATVRRQPEPEPEPATPFDCEYDPKVIELARRIQAGDYSFEDLLTLNKIISRSTVVETRNDDRLRVDTSVSLLDSKLDGALTRILSAVEKPEAITKWKRIATLAISAAFTMGVIMASCKSGYLSASADAVKPAQRAEEKAEQAEVRVDDIAKVLANRIKANEDKDIIVEKRLAKIEDTLSSTNTVLLQISAKLGAAPEPAKKKQR